MVFIERTFHSVGHGAFYTEKHINKENDEVMNIVYDCGSSKTDLIVKYVPKVFNSDDTIDCLFISHLDKDHISGIEKLKNTVNQKINCVVMPLLNNIDKLFLLGKKNENYIRRYGLLVTDSDSYFGDKSVVLYVRKDHPTQEDTQYETTLSQDQQVRILDNNALCLIPKAAHFHKNWIFKHYNYDELNRVKQFKQNLVNKRITGIEKYSAQDLLNLLIGPNNRLTDIKDCYKKLKGGTNESSMVIYSGPRADIDFSAYHTYNVSPNFANFKWRERPACLYTGDFNSNKKDLSDPFKEVWDCIGTIQVPHHGSIHNYNPSNLFGFLQGVYCPISHRTNDKHHPMLALKNNPIQTGNQFVSVTQDPTTKFTETFQYK